MIRFMDRGKIDLCDTMLTLTAPIPDKEKKNNLKLYFHISLWCLKRHHKEVWKQKFKVIFILIQLFEMYGVGKVNSHRNKRCS